MAADVVVADDAVPLPPGGGGGSAPLMPPVSGLLAVLLTGSEAGMTATGAVRAGVSAVPGATGRLVGGMNNADAALAARTTASPPATGNRLDRPELAGMAGGNGLGAGGGVASILDVPVLDTVNSSAPDRSASSPSACGP
ncbi:MAG: hypothetical protein ACRDRX_02995 [Pseudonocardiaceae bacterium]